MILSGNKWCQHASASELLPAGSGNIASGQQSDHLLLVAAISGWLSLGADSRKPQAQQVHLRGYLKKYFLHEQTLKELQVRARRQLCIGACVRASGCVFEHVQTCVRAAGLKWCWLLC